MVVQRDLSSPTRRDFWAAWIVALLRGSFLENKPVDQHPKPTKPTKFSSTQEIDKDQFGLPVNPEPAALLAGEEDHRGGISHLEIIQVGAAAFFSSLGSLQLQCIVHSEVYLYKDLIDKEGSHQHWPLLSQCVCVELEQ